MALAMHSTLTISCESSEEQSGPTIVHSTGVGDYRVQPEIIRILQESCSNDKLCDHEKGVQCTDPAAHIIETFQHVGFSVTASSVAGDRKIWLLTKTNEGGSGGDKKKEHGGDGGDAEDAGDAGDAGDAEDAGEE